MYVGLIAACTILEPEALPIVLPALFIGAWLNIVRGRPWVGFASAIFVLGAIGSVAHQIGIQPFEDPPSVQEPQASEVTYKNLTVDNVGGRYGGTVELTNHTHVHADMWVTVHVFDGEQDLGELSGNISLKPHSTATLDLQGYDEYRPFTDTVVELSGVPAAVS